MFGLDVEAKKKAKRNQCAYVGCFQTWGDPAYTHNRTCTLYGDLLMAQLLGRPIFVFTVHVFIGGVTLTTNHLLMLLM